MGLSKRKYMKKLRLMADYSASGLWDEAGKPADLDDYPIAKTTRKLIDVWSDWYEDSNFYLVTNGTFLNCTSEEFYDLEDIIHRRLIKELPDYEITRFTEVPNELINDVFMVEE